jgi:hypothetical protein
VIRGNLDRLHLGDLLQWLQMGGLTGRLTLTVEGRQRRLDLLEGRIVFASSTVPDERLASWLAHEGVLPATRLRQCLGYSLLRRTFLTQVLIEDAGLTAEALKLSITRLAEAITTRVLFAPRVEFEFDPGYPIRDFLGLVVDLEPNALLMEAARRTDESRHEAAQREEEILPFTGEAFDKFFWSIIREGVSGGELLDGERFVEPRAGTPALEPGHGHFRTAASR